MSRKISLWIASSLFAFACIFFFGKLIASLASAKVAGMRAAQVVRQSIVALEKQHDNDMARLRTELLLAGLEKETALYALRNRDADAYDNAKDSVFFLTVQSAAFAEDEKTVIGTLRHSASGSVFAHDDAIYFVTSSHAVTTVEFPLPRIRVTKVAALFLNGDVVELEILGHSKECDITLLMPKDKTRSYGKPLKLIAHDAIRRGMRVMLLGILPAGRATSFATYGEVNAVDVADGGGWLPRLVISSPYILHGFSGGPLVSVDTGEMVGINGRSRSDRDDDDGGGIRIPMAMPAETLRVFLPRLTTPGRMHHGATGATLEDNPHSSTSLRIRNIATKSPAEGKLQKGDLIEMIDGSPIRSLFSAELRVLAAAPGTTMRLAGTRDGKPFDVELILASLDNDK